MDRRGFLGLLAGVPLLRTLPAVIAATTPVRTENPVGLGNVVEVDADLRQKQFQYVRAAETVHAGDLVEWVDNTYAVRKARTGPIVGVAVAPVLDRGNYGFVQIGGSSTTVQVR